MKIAVGIIAIFLSIIALMQSFTITGLSGLVEDKSMQEAGSFGVLTAFLLFFGGVFSFGLPKVAQVLFVLAFLVSLPAREAFPDMVIWGAVAVVLAFLLRFVAKKKVTATTES